MCIYAAKDLLNYDHIVIDTSVLMKGKGVTKFINNVSSTLMFYRQKITVPTAVWLELTRHMNSKNQSLATIASNSINTVNSHRYIFQIDDRNIDYSDMDEAFADKEIYANLVLNKTKYRQLLITNDVNLAKDVVGINDQKSCYGYRIDVCRLSRCGNLVDFDFGESDITLAQGLSTESIVEITDSKTPECNSANIQISNATDKHQSVVDNITVKTEKPQKGNVGTILLAIYASLTTLSTGFLLWDKYGKKENSCSTV